MSKTEKCRMAKKKTGSENNAKMKSQNVSKKNISVKDKKKMTSRQKKLKPKLMR